MVTVTDKRGQVKSPPRWEGRTGPGYLPGFQDLHYLAALGVALHYQGAIDFALGMFKRGDAAWKIKRMLQLSRGAEVDEEPSQKNVLPMLPKQARNAPCPCGSERKFKKCCGLAYVAGVATEIQEEE